MSGSVNKVILIGNLGRDPDVRVMQNGNKVVNLSLATSERWKDRDGNKQERTEWHRVVIFNDRLADVADRYLRKGMKVYLEGALQTRKWTDQSGQEKYTTEVVLAQYRGELVMLDSQGGGNTPPPANGPQDYGTARAPAGQTSQPTDYPADLDDEIPF